MESFSEVMIPRRAGAPFRQETLDALFGCDYIVPMGEMCCAWMLLADLGLRKATLPFDYLGYCSPRLVAKYLEDFRKDGSYESFLPPRGASRNRDMVCFAHICGSLRGSDSLEDVVSRRVRRLREELGALRPGQKVLFLHTAFVSNPFSDFSHFLSTIADLRRVSRELQLWCASQQVEVRGISLWPRDILATWKDESHDLCGPHGDDTLLFDYVDVVGHSNRLFQFRAGLAVSSGYQPQRLLVGHSEFAHWSRFFDNEAEFAALKASRCRETAKIEDQ
jgi:hypothetical protein